MCWSPLRAATIRTTQPRSRGSNRRELCLHRGLRANDIPDAWIAAAVRQLGDHLVSFDADFRKLLKRSELTLLRA